MDSELVLLPDLNSTEVNFPGFENPEGFLNSGIVFIFKNLGNIQKIKAVTVDVTAFINL